MGFSVATMLIPASTCIFIFFLLPRKFVFSFLTSLSVPAPLFNLFLLPNFKAQLNSNLNCEALPEHDSDFSYTYSLLHIFWNT